MSKFNTINGLVSEIAKREGKKSQARHGDIKEIIGILADIMEEVTDEDLNTVRDPHHLLQRLAEQRRKKKARAKR